MAIVKLNVFLKDKDSGEFSKVIAQINPNCQDAKLVETVNALENLTDNKVSTIWKIVEQYLTPEDDGFVTVEEIKKILAGEYTPVEDSDPVTEQDILLILGGKYTPAEDTDTWSDKDFVF